MPSPSGPFTVVRGRPKTVNNWLPGCSLSRPFMPGFTSGRMYAMWMRIFGWPSSIAACAAPSKLKPGEHQIVVAPGGGPNDLFDHLRSDGAVLRAEYHTDRGLTL